MTEPPQRPPWNAPGPPPPAHQYPPPGPNPAMPAPQYPAPGVGPPPGPASQFPPAPGGWSYQVPGPSGWQPGIPGRPGLALPPSVRPVHIDPVPGTNFGVAYLPVNPTSLGLATGSMVAGIGSLLVALVVVCFGVTGASPGWGPLVSGAFAILSALLGGAAIASGLIAARQIRAAPGRLRGRGLALAGVWCGSGGLGLAAFGFVLALLLS